MIDQQIEIPTKDGHTTTFITHPERGGPFPVIIFYMDAPAIREELREDGICTFAQGSLRIMKLPELFQAGQYRWDYLYLGADLDHEIRERVSVGPLRRRASA